MFGSQARRRSRLLPLLSTIALMMMLLGPLAGSASLAGEDPPVEEENAGEQPTEVPEEVVPTEAPTEVPADAVATEVPTEIPAVAEPSTLTITVYRCDHPTYDTGFSENLQTVLDTCREPGYGTFIAISVTEETKTGSSLTFEFESGRGIQEILQPGYDNPIADCYVYDAGGNLMDRIGPGETSGGGWRLGGTEGDVHCDWYQVDRGLGNVYIVNMACPSTAGLFPDPTMDQLIQVCTEPAGQRHFLVEHGPGLERQGVSSGEFNDTLVEAVSTGPIAIRLSDPEGFDKARVFCQIFDTDQITQISPFTEYPVGNFRASGLTLVSQQRIHCSWFNIQEGPGFEQGDGNQPPAATETPGQAPSDLTIRLHTCQPNYDFEADAANPAQDCPEGPDGVTFAIAPAGEPDDSTEGTTGETQPNAVTFAGLAPGDYVVTQDVPNNIGTVFVLGCGGGGGVDPIPQVIDGTLQVGIPQGVIMTCQWFNIRGGGNVVEDAATGETGRIVIQTSICPTDEVDPSLGVEAVAEACSQRMEDISFAATAGEGYEQSGISDGEGTVLFEEVPAGDATITETIPEGYGDPIVFCASFLEGELPSASLVYEQVTPTAGSIVRTVEPGFEVSCAWFNVPGVPTEAIDADALDGTASLTIHKYECPAGFDVTTVDSNPSTACTTPGVGISFDIDDEIDDNAGRSIETGLDGIGSADEFAAGTYTIDEGVRNGTTSVFVWDCYDASGTSTRTDPLAMSSSIQIEIEDGAQIRCDWYNVVGGTSRVIVNKHACPVLAPAYTLTYEELQQQCTDDFAPVDIYVVSDTFQEEQPASQNPLQLASFANVPSGYIAVGETKQPGWGTPVVWCQVNTELQEVVQPPMAMDVIQSSFIYVDLKPGEVMYCDWYNVIEGNVDIFITKVNCPEGFAEYGATIDEMYQACTLAAGPIEFTAESDSKGYIGTATANDGTNGNNAAFDDVPSGQIRISEELPDGYGLPIVWCRIDVVGGDVIQPMQPETVGSSSSITKVLAPGQVMNCVWFNIPGGEGMVSIWKEACPDGFDANNATRQQLENACNEPIPNIQFTLISGSFAGYATSTNNFRYADFNAVPAGPLTVSEQVQTDYDTAVVWCHVQSDAGGVTDPVKVDVTGGNTISWDLKADEWLICEWYNAHDANNTIVIHKYDCPEGTDPEHDRAWFEAECTTPHNEVEFIITSGNGVSIDYTANGMVEFPGIPLGNTLIQESIPEGYGDPVVFCGFAPIAETVTEINPARAEGGAINMAFDEAPYRFECWWFNIKDGPGEIWIEKYTCPEGYDVHAHDADPVKDCPEATNGVRFSLGNESAGFTATTGEEQDGVAIFREVEYGRWTIAEEIPDGTREVFVLDCTGQRQGELRPTPLSFGGSLEIDLHAGEKITCRWYNVPEDDPDYGRITVIKYRCTTDEFVSDVDCEIEEGGVTIDLAWWNGDDWETVSTRETDGAGRATWTELESGQYWLDERDGSFCYLASDGLDDDGNWLNVEAGEETVVYVYNCGAEPGKPGKTPITYPNTGVPPATIPNWTTP